MTERREVCVSIGKQSYIMHTELDNDTLDKVVGIANEVCGAINGSLSQDSLLMLTCLQLAYNLEKISERLEPLDRKLSGLRR